MADTIELIGVKSESSIALTGNGSAAQEIFAVGSASQRGPAGPEGPAGPAGSGVPDGGTAGQVLTKINNTDQNTQWSDAPGALVSSVNSQVGDVVLGKSDVGLANVDNTSDVNKPVSSATQTALNAKEGTITAGTSAQYYRGDKSFQTLNQDAVPDGTTNKAYTATEKTKLAGIETAADVTDAGNVGSSIHGATAKTTPIDADEMALIDSAASNALKRVTWANIKATFKTYLDTLYQPVDSDLTTIAGLTATTDSFMQAKAGAWAARTIAQVKSDLSLSGSNTGDQTISDATLSTSDITTNNFTTSKHGFVPKGTNVGNFLKDDGTWATPSGGGGGVSPSSPNTWSAAQTYNAGMLLDKGSIVYDVRAFGAVGDDSTDDTAAIQSAIDAAQAAKGTVLFSRGLTYKITAALKLYTGTTPTITSYTNMTLDLNGATIKQYTTGADVIKGINDVANGAQSLNLTIRNGTLLWGTATKTNSGNGIYFSQQAAGGPSYQLVRIERVVAQDFQGSGKYGFNIESAILTTFETCMAVTCANGFYLNGAVGGAYNSVSTSVTFLNCYANMATNGQVGFNILDNTYISFVGCAVDIGANNSASAYLIDGSNDVSFQGCGVELNGTATLANGIKIQGGSSQIGIYNSYFFQSKTMIDIYVTGTSTGVTIIGAQDNSSVSGSTGLKVDAGSSVTEIDNNWGGVATPRNINATGIDHILADAAGNTTLPGVLTALLGLTNVASPEKLLHIKGDQSGGMALIERTNSATNAVLAGLIIRGTSSGQMANGFGAGMSFQARDADGVNNPSGYIQTIRAGADNTHALQLYSVNAGSAVMNLQLNADGTVTVIEGGNLVLGTTTGTKFGTSTSQKIGFYNSTPIVKPTGDIATALSNLGLVASPVISVRTNTVASSATPSINTDTTDEFTITALAAAITSMTTNLTGTPVNGQKLMIRIKDNGTARAITWGASFVSSGVATLLATTVISKTHNIFLKYDSAAAKWVCMAVDATGY